MGVSIEETKERRRVLAAKCVPDLDAVGTQVF
jgi:hypothetical protein